MERKNYFLALFFLVFPSIAHAYIDPGTGSLLLQGIIAAFISALVFWRNLRTGIMDFFRGGKRKETPSKLGKSADGRNSDFEE